MFLSKCNKNAALCAIMGLFLLSIALSLPFVTLDSFGDSKAYSMFGGILELFRCGHVFVGSILLVFSIVFPFAKLGMLLVATSSLVQMSRAKRENLCRLATLAGKYSLLDVLVLAVMIVVIKVDGFVEASPSVGTLLFTIAIALSILAGTATDFSHLREEA